MANPELGLQAMLPLSSDEIDTHMDGNWVLTAGKNSKNKPGGGAVVASQADADGLAVLALATANLAPDLKLSLYKAPAPKKA
jgi:hypothetical protein